MSQLKFSLKIWNNISIGGKSDPSGPTPWLRPWFYVTTLMKVTYHQGDVPLM